MKWFLVSILFLILASCAPATNNARAPITFGASATQLFDATLAAVATTTIKNPLGKEFTFAIKTATKDAGLIVASNVEGYQITILIQTKTNSTASFSYTLSSQNDAYFISNDFMQEVIKKLSSQFTIIQ
jgi:hypothetical protein